ncbi:MAG: YIP1 family protein [Candidatus Omnitrophota bacterium]
MIKIIDLFYKTITKPNEAFKRIKEEKPITDAFIIFFIYAFVNYFISKISIMKNPELFKELVGPQAKLIFNPIISIISSAIWLFIFNGILLFFVKKKNNSLKYSDILTLDFFTLTPIILLFIPQLLLLKLHLFSLVYFMSFIQLIWCLILLIIGIKVFISLETKDALIIYIKSSLIFALVILISIFLSTKLIGSGIYPIK